MSFQIQFEAGTFFCDRWPEDLQQTVGRMVISPWKTCYTQTVDHISCGRISRIVGSPTDPRIEFSVGATGGSIIAPLSACFLVPKSAEGGA